MKLHFLKWFLAVVIVSVFVAEVGAQRRGDWRSRGSGGKRSFDPVKTWEYMSRGRTSISISDFRFNREEAEAWAKKKGIRNGKLTKTQFLNYMKDRTKKWEERKKEFERRMKLPLTKRAALYLKDRDKNKDGYIDKNEADRGLRYYGKKYDKNGDGKFTRAELQEWFAGVRKYAEQRRKGRENDKKQTKPNGTPQRIVIEALATNRPVVFARGKLPNGTPDWYTETDIDKDGQVGLYEWRKKGKAAAEFLKLDTNQDGFITPDEMVRAEERDVQATPKNDSGGSRGSNPSRRRR